MGANQEPDRWPTVAVAGHICLDIIPELPRASGPGGLFVPGRLVNVGRATLSTGGAVSNTGIALHRLGVPTRLLGKVGDDAFGELILDIVRSQGPGLADRMIVEPGERSSYSIVLSPPGVDRTFLHDPGANDTFDADDVDAQALDGVSAFHFGYPPVMRRMYADGGARLEVLLRRAKAGGATVSVDMAQPDPDSDAGRADWTAILRRVLPHVDVFLPSLDEILYMMRMNAGPAAGRVRPDVLRTVADRLLEWGAGAVGIKLGDQGMYLRTSQSVNRLSGMGRGFPGEVDPWVGRELIVPCLKADVVGTTGAGDSTVAGFLAALLRGMTPEEALTRAAAVGACSVEALGATAGVRSWDETEGRLSAGWERAAVDMDLDGWRWDGRRSVWSGPMDKGGGLDVDPN